MAMPDNPFPITTVGHDTRFGAKNGPDPRAAAEKRNAMHPNRLSVRDSIRRLAAMEVEVGKPVSQRDIARVFGREGVHITLAQSIAWRKYQKALLDGDVKAMQQIEEAIDGKVPNQNINTEASLAELIAAARKEIRDESTDTGSD